MRALSLIILMATTAGAQELGVMVTTLQPQKGHSLRTAWTPDLDGDGRSDLVLLEATAEEPHGRILRGYLRKKSDVPFTGTPDIEVRLTPDVAGVSFADVEARPGQEIVLFNRHAAYVLNPKAEGRERLRKLFDTAFLWQFPDDPDAIPWTSGILDLNGDGHDDFLVPEPSALRIAIQKRDEKGRGRFPDPQVIHVPRDTASRLLTTDALRREQRQTGRRIALRVGVDVGDEGTKGPLLSISEHLPAPQLSDWDGDGDPDLLLRTPEALHVWVQAKGRFSKHAHYPMPVVRDRQRLLDLSYSDHVVDLDGNNRADCILIAGNQRAKNLRAQVLVYVQGATGRGPRATTPAAPLFGPRGIPQQLIGLAGLVADARLFDIDGNGHPDLSVTTFEPDFIDKIRSRSGTVDLGLAVFLNRDGRLSPRADLVAPLQIAAKSIESGSAMLSARFVSDQTGDGLADLLVQDDARHVRLHALARKGRGLVLVRKPIWNLRLPSEARLHAIEPSGPHTEAIFIGNREGVHVRFPR